MNAQTRESGSGISTIDLAIIIVSYNVRDLLRQCLRSIEATMRLSKLTYYTIVIDNLSGDGSASMVRAEFPDVEVIEPGTNTGFAGGNNIGLRRVMERTADRADSMPRYVLLLNPDTEIVGAAIDRLVRYLDQHPHVAVVGPQLRFADGSLQSSRRRFPTIGTLFWESTLLEQWFPRNRWARRYHCDDQASDREQRVDWLVGAALLVRRAAIERAGLLDQGFFMYSEELEWQHRLGSYGAVMYVPEAVVIHHEGKSSEQNMARRHIDFNRSKLRYARLRWGMAVFWMLRVFLLATYLMRWLIEAGKWVLGHKRALRRQRIAQYSAILRSGL